MRIVVTNTALLNAGDAAIMGGTQTLLREAFGVSLRLSVRDLQPQAAVRLYPELRPKATFTGMLDESGSGLGRKIRLLRLLTAATLWSTPFRAVGLRILPHDMTESFIDYVEADAIASAGGTYLVPHYRIRPKILELLVARLAGRPYVLMTQSLGPFGRRQWLLRWLLRGAALILVRDVFSEQQLRRAGVGEERIARCADAAFALPLSPEESKGPPGHSRPTKDGRRRPDIAISVRDWPHTKGLDGDSGMDRYREAIAGLVTFLVDTRDADITFLSTCQGNDAYWTDDADVAAEIVADLAPETAERCTILRDHMRPDEMHARLSRFDLFVSTRMHGAILAIMAGIPTIAIAYEFKTTELFRALGLSDFCHTFETIEAESLVDTANAALEGSETLASRLTQKRDELTRSARRAVGPLVDALPNR